jgi:hypothetical protein
LLHTELKSRLVAEKSLEFLLSSIDHVQSKEDSLHFILQVMHCILHLENRSKLFVLMLREGLSNAQGMLHEETMNISSMEGREGKFIEMISGIMNEEILGSVDNKAQ